MAIQSKISNFFKELRVELFQKVTWPSRKELLEITGIVIVFVVVWAVYVGVVDFIFAKGLEAFLNFAKGGG